MAWKNFTHTLAGATAEAISAVSAKAKSVRIQPRRTNSHVLYVGGSSVTSSNGYELNFPANAAANLDHVDLDDYSGNGMDLASIYVIGTAGETVQGIYEEF